MSGTFQTEDELREVVAYWLAAIRIEEALAGRPVARTPPKTLPTIDVNDPGPGQGYFRLGSEHAAFFLGAVPAASAVVDSGTLRFLERWLRSFYRREAAAARGNTDARADVWIAGWPAILFPRKKELAAILRFPVDVEWRREGAPWRPPPWVQRRQKAPAPPPDAVTVRWERDGEGGVAACSVDFLLLHRTLGVSEEDLREAMSRWEEHRPPPSAIARDIIGLLGGTAPPRTAEPEVVWAALSAAAAARASDGVKVFTTGLVQDGALLAATYHLQRELAALLASDAPPLRAGTALRSYLSGAPLAEGWAPLLARRAARGLTPHQRAAGERFLGSKLTAVEGPPGTGKTELILDLAAHALVERVDGLARGEPMGTRVLLVTSTNNRAVDNVLDPLGRLLPSERLPLGLRTGSQAVTLNDTRTMLMRARAWLAARDVSGARGALQAALHRFERVREKLSAALGPEVTANARRVRLAELRAELGVGPERERRPASDDVDARAAGAALPESSSETSNGEPRTVGATRSQSSSEASKGDLRGMDTALSVSSSEVSKGDLRSADQVPPQFPPEVSKAERAFDQVLRATLDPLIEGGRRRRRTFEAAWGRVQAAVLPVLDVHFPRLAEQARAALPPHPDQHRGAAALLDAWEDGLWELEDVAEAMREELVARASAAKAAARREALVRELAALEAELARESNGAFKRSRQEEQRADRGARREGSEASEGREANEGRETGETEGSGAASSNLESLAHAVFEAAVEVRERWAVANGERLTEALDVAIGFLQEQPSLRRLEGAPRQWIERLFPTVGCTLLSLGNVFENEPESIAHVVVDEAGQCHPAYVVSALFRAERALVIGDVHQLPPVIQLPPADEARALTAATQSGARRKPESRASESPKSLEPYRVGEDRWVSAQSLAQRAAGERRVLRDHFRCQPEIIALSDRLCAYDFVVHTPRRTLRDRVPRLSEPVLFGDVDGAQVEARGSWANAQEASALVDLLTELGAHGIPWSQIAVLTPYVAQFELLRHRITSARIPLEASEELDLSLFPDEGGVAAGTVHRFQGGERPVVLLSTVITEPRSLPFLDRRAHLLNVAISRARDHLVIFGHAEALLRGRNTRVLVEAAKRLADPPR